MNCGRIEERLPLFVSGDLAPPEMDEMRRHIDSCEACAGLAALLNEDASWLRRTGAPEFDESELAALRSSVNRRLDEEAAAPGLLEMFTRFLAWRPVIAAAAIILIALIYLFSDRTTAPEEPLIVRDAEIRDGGVIEDPKPVKPPPAKKQVKRTRRRPAGDRMLAQAEPAQATPLRIEIQTTDPNIRIIWLASTGQ